MAYGIIEQGWPGLDPRLKAFTSLARVRLAINFGDFAGQRSVKNQAGPEYGYLQGTAKITPDGLVVDGSSNCNLVIPSAFGVSNSSSSMILVGATLPSGNQSGALIKVGEASDGIALGVGSGTLDSDGANCIGLLEAVAWVPSTTPCTNGYHTLGYLHYQAGGDRAAIAVDGTPAVAGSTDGAMVAATGNTYIGGYGTRMASATIHWVVIIEGAAGTTGLYDNFVALAPKIWPAHGYGWKRAVDNDPVFYSLGGGGATDYPVTATDALTLADSASQSFAATVVAAEAMTLADSASNVAALGASGTAALTLADSASNVAALSATATDALTLADTLNATASGDYTATSSDALTLADSASNVAVLGATGSDALTLADAASNVAAFIATITEAMTLADTSNGSTTGMFTATITESMFLADTLLAAGGSPASFWTQISTTQVAGWGQTDNTQSSGWTIIPTT